MSEKVYLNGELVETSNASVNISNPSLLHGVGLFETLRTYDGRPFRLDRHIERLTASADKLNMTIANIAKQVPSAIDALLEANKLKNARVRFTVTPPSPQEEGGKPTLLVVAQELTSYPAQLYEQGMTVFVCNDYRQSSFDPLAGHKTTSYFARLLVLRNAQDRHCGEALWFTPANFLAEGCISNIFLVKDNRLHTPPLDTPVLPGVTRAAVLELAQSQDIPADEAPRTINDLLDADEVFLTNSIMEVMPVTRIEKRPIANEKPGPLTKQLHDAYRELTKSV